MAARTYGGWCDKWLLGHLAADKWRLIHLAARVDPYNMGQMAVGTFGGWDIWRSGHLAVIFFSFEHRIDFKIMSKKL